MYVHACVRACVRLRVFGIPVYSIQVDLEYNTTVKVYILYIRMYTVCVRAYVCVCVCVSCAWELYGIPVYLIQVVSDCETTVKE